jgi:NAD(P)-dependent dehydrogenase (short-subunit alcohol dehydrogenase family)
MVADPGIPAARSQAGRTFVVTGGNGGLGMATARELARAGARVVLAVRDLGRGREAADALRRDLRRHRDEHGGADVDDGALVVCELDLADLRSVRRFAESWTDDTLDTLVNNAGVMALPHQRTHDGFEMHIGSNHLGHFALTCLLLPRITDRVVTVSSLMHRHGRIRLDDLNWDRRRYRRWQAYSQSKLANLLFTLELQRRLDSVGSAVRSVAAHPGWAATGLQHHTGSPLLDGAMGLVTRVVSQSAEQGALPLLYAATQDIPGNAFVGPGGVGELRGHPTLVGRSAAATDREAASALWQLSERLTGVHPKLGRDPTG